MRRPSPRPLALLAMLWTGLALFPRGAFADAADAFSLAWEGPPECPSTAWVKTEVARLLGGAPHPPAGGPVVAHARVQHGPGWSVDLTTRHAGQDGRRTLEAASCQDLAAATALILALMIDPDAVAARAQAPQPEAPPPAPLVPRPVAPPRTVAFLAGLHGQASVGTLPGVDLGVGASLGLSGPRWRMELRGTYGLRRDQVAEAPDLPGAHGKFNFLAGALVGCLAFGPRAVTFGPCLDAEAGVVSAKGFGTTRGYSARSTWLALGGGGYLAIALGPHLAIPLHLDLLVPLRRPEYIIEDLPSRVFQAPPVGGRFQVGIEARF